MCDLHFTIYVTFLLINSNFFDRCIPFKYRNRNCEEGDCDGDGDGGSEKIVEVLMINSTSGPGLLFPKVPSHFSL